MLGLAWLRGPCTIYSIMRELSLSASSFHKSRAGTAYSVSKRLLGFGLLKPHSKGENDVEITEDGLEALRGWLAPPIPMQDIAHSADFLRLRFFFLGALPIEDRLRFIDEASAGLELFLRRCEDLVAENEAIGDYFGALATLSSILETKARLNWLRIVRQLVAEPLDQSKPWSQSLLDQV